MDQIFIVFENEFCEGEFINRRPLGVFSTAEKAHDHVRLCSDSTIYDPIFRTSYEVVSAIVDEPIDMDDE